MQRAYYSASVSDFLATGPNEIVGALLTNSGGSATEHTQRDAWIEQIRILRDTLRDREGRIYFEYSVPRMGSRIDSVLLIGQVLFGLEFKIGERDFTSHARTRLRLRVDLKNFHRLVAKRHAPIVMPPRHSGTRALATPFITIKF